MVYKTKQEEIGITIRISSHRKRGNGAIGSNRKNTSGKKATISKTGSEDVVITGNTSKDLLRKVRRQFNIPPNIQINENGQTCI